jgi:hypothetical protein
MCEENEGDLTMTFVFKPMRRWSKSVEPSQKELDAIQRGELAELPQGGDNPSKFLYKDMGGHLYWVKLQPYEKCDD